jgi:hypothetical protein
MLHRDILTGNVLITEDEKKGFLIDLDHAIRISRKENSGAKGRTRYQSIQVYWLVASE